MHKFLNLYSFVANDSRGQFTGIHLRMSWRRLKNWPASFQLSYYGTHEGPPELGFLNIVLASCDATDSVIAYSTDAEGLRTQLLKVQDNMCFYNFTEIWSLLPKICQ
ncbi:hypothetical protein RJ641_006032 [Dillenia turbinata]|uniref:Uncharacterized protein n=1 Tax=Dillenia turbinata TaxID=194707 RepID=A0AAN8VCE4_9MAGN